MCFIFKKLNCPVCLDKINDIYALKCGHVLCEYCLKKLKRKDMVKCPLCRIRSKIIYVINCHCSNCFKSLKKCKLFECGHPYCLDCLNEYKYNCCSYSEIIDLFL